MTLCNSKDATLGNICQVALTSDAGLDDLVKGTIRCHFHQSIEGSNTLDGTLVPRGTVLSPTPLTQWC